MAGIYNNYICEFCGITFIRLASQVKKTTFCSKSCYIKSQTGRTSKRIYPDLTGRRYGRLVVLESLGVRKNNGKSRRHWKCLCDCGNVVEVNGNNLHTLKTRSCGCLRIDYPPNYKHGMMGTSERRIWGQMRGRCLNPKNHAYHNYGGRGIKICDRWLESFENFYADMGERPSPRHSIDRKDNDGNYSPENCRWATPKEQCNNTRFTLKYSYMGQTLSITEWAEKLKINPGRLYQRIKRGWPFEKAIDPQRHHGSRYRVQGKNLSELKR